MFGLTKPPKLHHKPVACITNRQWFAREQAFELEKTILGKYCVLKFTTTCGWEHNVMTINSRCGCCN